MGKKFTQKEVYDILDRIGHGYTNREIANVFNRTRDSFGNYRRFYKAIQNKDLEDANHMVTRGLVSRFSCEWALDQGISLSFRKDETETEEQTDMKIAEPPSADGSANDPAGINYVLHGIDALCASLKEQNERLERIEKALDTMTNSAGIELNAISMALEQLAKAWLG